MTLPAILAAGVLFGLASAAHCAGMCGAFALHAARGTSAVWRFSLYGLGKIFAYVFLGALAGALGGTLSSSMHAVQQILGGLVALALALAALHLWRPARPAGGATLAAGVSRLVGNLYRDDLPGGRFSLGALSGLVPCGLVYLAALQAAALGSGAEGALFMAAFGVGTAPVLAVVGFAGRRLSGNWTDRRWRVAGAVLLGSMALVAGLRATMISPEDGCVACRTEAVQAAPEPTP